MCPGLSLEHCWHSRAQHETFQLETRESVIRRVIEKDDEGFLFVFLELPEILLMTRSDIGVVWAEEADLLKVPQGLFEPSWPHHERQTLKRITKRPGSAIERTYNKRHPCCRVPMA
jgi:hypothetical protein